MKLISSGKPLLACGLGLLALASAPYANGEGSETLGPAAINIASGSGIVAAGTGLATPRQHKIHIMVPNGARVKQALLYWEGYAFRTGTALPTGDNTAVVDGREVTGTLIGGPTQFDVGSIPEYYSIAYRADITSLNVVQPGNNQISISGIDFDRVTDGAGLLVIYDDGTSSDIQIRDGLDLAYINFADSRQTTVEQFFTFAPSSQSRTATLSLFFASVEGRASGLGNFRPSVVEVDVGGSRNRLVNELGSRDGEEWDTVYGPVIIPAGATSLRVQALSLDVNQTGEAPASFAWLTAGLSVPSAVQPRIELSKRADKSTVTPGGLVTYTYEVRNPGSTTLTDVVVVDDNGTPDFTGDDVEVGRIASLAPGGTRLFSKQLVLPLDLCMEDGSGNDLNTGRILTEVLPDGNIRATFIQSTNVNDNTYGVNSIGWGKKTHKFGNLLGSDQATFQMMDAAGKIVLEFKMDYITAAKSVRGRKSSGNPATPTYPSGYGTLGVLGGDGGMKIGSAASILSYTTSLTENLNKAPFLNNLAQYTENSPAPSDPNSSAWEYRMVYTVVVDKAAFGAAGFGNVMIIDQHNSPSKTGSFTPMTCDACVTNIARVTAHAGSAVLTATATAAVCTETPNDGGSCPLEYSKWKKKDADWSRTGFTRATTLGSIFNLPANVGSVNLLNALSGKAGDKELKDLLKQAAAGILNASDTGIRGKYKYTALQVIALVNQAATGGKDAIKAAKKSIEEANKSKCEPPKSGGDCTTDGKPNRLTLVYTGSDCSGSNNSQPPGKTSCNDFGGNLPLNATVEVSNSSTPNSGTVFFRGPVSAGVAFTARTANAGDTKFGSNTYVHVLSASGAVLQTIQIHTSCSAPLIAGQQFGSMILQSYAIE